MFPLTYNRVEVYKQTRDHYKNVPTVESIVNRRSNEITFKEMESLSYNYPKQVIAPVINKDCVYVALDYVERGFHPILLNMSSWRCPGGGVKSGASAQEEELFRRSNYFKHLHEKYYPFRNYDTIVSKGVEFLRSGSDKGYTSLSKPFKIDCIAAPALRNPQLSSSYDDFGNEEDIYRMEQKIRVLLYTAAKNGNDSIILSAWGCGAFGCPPKGVAGLFKKVLKEFAGVFRETPFAIIGANFQPFFEEFQTI